MNRKMRPWIIVALLIALLVMTTACGGSSGSDNRTSGSSNDGGASSQSGEAYEVGEGRVVTYSDSLGSEWVIISVPVTNTGDTNLYLSSGTMDIEDQDGHLVDSKSLVSVYPEVLQPGESQELAIEFNQLDFASFDEDGVTGFANSFIATNH